MIGEVYKSFYPQAINGRCVKASLYFTYHIDQPDWPLDQLD